MRVRMKAPSRFDLVCTLVRSATVCNPCAAAALRQAWDTAITRELFMVAKLIVQTVVWFGAMGLLLFLAAGTLNWPAAWIFLAVMVAFSLVGGLALGRHDPELLRERLAPPVQKDQPTADKVLLVIILLVIFGSLALM